MTTLAGKVLRNLTFRRGIHPAARKELSQSEPIEAVGVAAGSLVVVPLAQHIGAPCQATVQPREAVQAGQEIGTCDAFVSAPVHSPINGTVKEISPQPCAGPGKVLSVVITASDEPGEGQAWRELPGGFSGADHASEAIVEAIRRAGIVGQGGAAFPAAVKLTANAAKPVDTVLLNGCECEPYLTSDHRLMVEAPGPMVAGLQLAMRAAGAERGIIAIEDNKGEAIESVLAAIADVPELQLAVCQTKYPQGGERQLIQAVVNRVVPTGGLPLDVGVVVVNAGTASAIAWACVEGRPVTERIVCVTGGGIERPGNFRVPVGMLVKDLVERCGGLRDEAQQVVLGGPMMGPTVSRLDVPIVKGTSGVLVMSRGEVAQREEMACIRCGRCVDNCPVRLVPTRIAHAAKARDIAMALENDLMACIECGCCTYVCPSKIPLVQYMRAGKQLARQAKRT